MKTIGAIAIWLIVGVIVGVIIGSAAFLLGLDGGWHTWVFAAIVLFADFIGDAVKESCERRLGKPFRWLGGTP